MKRRYFTNLTHTLHFKTAWKYIQALIAVFLFLFACVPIIIAIFLTIFLLPLRGVNF